MLGYRVGGKYEKMATSYRWASVFRPRIFVLLWYHSVLAKLPKQARKAALL